MEKSRISRRGMLKGAAAALLALDRRCRTTSLSSKDTGYRL